MKARSRARVGVIAAICVLLGFGVLAFARAHSSVWNVEQKGAGVATHASGTFEVKLVPQAAEDKVGDPTVGRMSIDKQFHGDLEGTSKGQMLAAMTEVNGSAGYVAMERVSGTLHGRAVTFALQHSGP